MASKLSLKLNFNASGVHQLAFSGGGPFRISTLKWPEWFVYMQDNKEGNVRGWKTTPGNQGEFLFEQIDNNLFFIQLYVGRIGICICKTTVKEMFEDGKGILVFKDTGSSLLEMMGLFFYPLRSGHTGTSTCKTTTLAISKAAMETLVRKDTSCSLATSSSAINRPLWTSCRVVC